MKVHNGSRTKGVPVHPMRLTTCTRPNAREPGSSRREWQRHRFGLTNFNAQQTLLAPGNIKRGFGNEPLEIPNSANHKVWFPAQSTPRSRAWSSPSAICMAQLHAVVNEKLAKRLSRKRKQIPAHKLWQAICPNTRARERDCEAALRSAHPPLQVSPPTMLASTLDCGDAVACLPCFSSALRILDCHCHFALTCGFALMRGLTQSGLTYGTKRLIGRIL